MSDEIKGIAVLDDRGTPLRLFACGVPDAGSGREEARGLSSRDKLVRSLGVSDGDRARYIRAKLDSMTDPLEKRDYVLRLAHAGVITERVAAQMKAPPR